MSRAVFSIYRPGFVIVLGLTLILTLAGTTGIEAGQCESRSVIAAENEIDLQVTDDDGDEIAEISVNGEAVLRIRAPLGGWSAAERGAIVLNRLQTMSADQKTLKTLEAGRLGNYNVVVAGSTVVITIDSQTADANQTTPAGLARVWCNNLRGAFGIPLRKYGHSSRWVSMVASWYGDRFAGLRTASGEIFDPTQLTAAHPSLPFGTLVQVTYPRTGKMVTVRINDRGPFVSGRDLDLSREAASRLGLLPHGVDSVRVAILQGEGASLE